MRKTQITKMKMINKVIIFILLIIISITGCDANKPNGEKQTTTDNLYTESSYNPEVEKKADTDLAEMQESLREIARKLTPAVVNIRTEVTVENQGDFGRRFDRDFFREFFGDDFDRFFGQQQPQQRKQYGLGSGFIINKDGYIVTNYHVVKDADEVIVVMEDGTEYKAEVIGVDATTDIGLIKINSKGKNLASVVLGDSSNLRVGDFAIAIGNPFGLAGSFTFGVISATGRDNVIDRNAGYKQYIQTDAPINRGNSGGPLVNIYGEVVGVNTAIFSTSGGSIGIGFAVPINIVKNVVKQIQEKGHVERGYIGVYIADLTSDMVEHFGLDSDKGVFINDVEEGGPADKAGIKSGDIITHVNGERIDSATHLANVVAGYEPGTEITVSVFRNGETLKKQMKVVERDTKNVAQTPDRKGTEDDGEMLENKWMGMTLGEASVYAERFGFNYDAGGVMVIDINTNSQAYEKGIRKGDIIQAVNYNEIAGLTDMKEFIRNNQNKQSFLIKGYRYNMSSYFVVLRNE